MHRPYPLAGAGAAATATTSTTTTTAAGGAAELEWTKRGPIAKGTARIQTPTASQWGFAVPPLATQQHTTTCAARPTAEASAQTPTIQAPTHSLKAPTPAHLFIRGRNKLNTNIYVYVYNYLLETPCGAPPPPPYLELGVT